MNEMNMTNPESTFEPLDKEWFEPFDRITSQNGDTIGLLDGSAEHRNTQKALFMSGEIQNPNLGYPNIDIDGINKEEQELLELKQTILSSEKPDSKSEVVAQAYRWRINERIAELRMLRATKEGDMHRFKRYAEFVYGKPSPEYFSYTVQEVLGQIEKIKPEDSKTIEKIEALRTSLAGIIKSEVNPEKPDPETVQTVHEIMTKEYEALGLENFDPEKTFTDEETVAIFEQALTSLGANEWQVVLTEDRGKINVSQEEKLVEVPKGRTIDFLKLQKLVMHEIVRHVGRRVKGENSRLSLLGRGLDRYLMGEEGITKVTEHAIEGKVKTFGTPELHLATGLAIGTDGNPRDFREVYNILEPYFYLKAIRLKKTPEEAEKDAMDKAWNHCVRVFRGTDCKTKGVCYPKDIVYREGSVAIWNLILKDTNEVYRFTIGKYDPNNQRHLWILSQLEITDEKLTELSM